MSNKPSKTGMSNQPSRASQSIRQTSRAGGSPSRTAAPPRRTAANYSAPRQRDPFPYVIGGVVALLVVGVVLVAFFLGSNSANSNTQGVIPAQASTNSSAAQPGVTVVDTSANASGDTSSNAASDPPRLGIVDFKAL